MVLNKLHFSFLIVMSVCHFWNIVLSELDFSNDEQNQKNFKSVPTTVKTFENDTVLLPCDTENTFRYVRWHRDDVLLVDSRHPEISIDKRIHLWSNGSLQVAHLRTQDTGDYYCEIYTHDNNHAVQVHAIEVQYEPRIASDPSGLVELPLGAVFEMVCEAVGVPQPVITWRHNGKTLNLYATGNRQSQLFDLKTREMSGSIQCLATNGVGQTAVAEVLLNVLFPPEISAIQSIVYTKIGQRATLECIVEAAPAAKVHWYHHGITVTSDIWMTNHETEAQAPALRYYTVMKHVLVVRKVRESDIGLYECRAENAYGFKSINIDLTGRPMPCSFKINPGLQSMTAHELVWVTESLSPIMEYKLQFRQISGKVSKNQTQIFKTDWTELTIPSELSAGAIYMKSYTLRGLQPASVYEVAVLARNHFGWSDNSKIVRFATGGEVELPNYSTESDMQYDDSGKSIEKQKMSEDEYYLNEIESPTVNSSHVKFLTDWLMFSVILHTLISY